MCDFWPYPGLLRFCRSDREIVRGRGNGVLEPPWHTANVYHDECAQHSEHALINTFWGKYRKLDKVVQNKLDLLHISILSKKNPCYACALRLVEFSNTCTRMWGQAVDFDFADRGYLYYPEVKVQPSSTETRRATDAEAAQRKRDAYSHMKAHSWNIRTWDDGVQHEFVLVSRTS